jgi:hypothetical protein
MLLNTITSAGSSVFFRLLGRFGSTLQFREARLDVFNLNCLGSERG